ncbi:MAG: hypothetical protein ROO76_07190 [Terriglobia bacterium]|nr:hypothetical protein [Terriglobia bacterium]
MRHLPIGSLWRKWDLHFHTPSSFDYADKSITDEKIIDTLVEAGIEVVAVTDHHVIDIARISNLSTIAAGRISILPGIEFRTELGGKQKVHLIGIFPENAKLKDIWTTVQGKLELTTGHIEKKGGDESVYVNFREAADVIHDLGGIVSVHAGTKSNTIETIGNKELFKQRLKKDLIRDYIDLYEIGKASDVTDYEAKVFPNIGKHIPLVICSDNHDIKNYALKASCWIKGDPCFCSFQQIKSDPNRVFIGDLPPAVDRIKKNPTKYIKAVQYKKLPGSPLPEEWFSGTVQINPGLVGIIGNKGSGKTALAETIGLLGNCELEKHFSFLNEAKFRQPKGSKAKHFQASLVWANDHQDIKLLSDSTNSSNPASISYIPQNYLETICNEVVNLPGSRLISSLSQ